MLKLILPLVKWLQDCSFSFPKHFIYLKVQLYLSHPLQFYFGPTEEDPFLNSKLAIASWVNHFLLKWSFFSEISVSPISCWVLWFLPEIFFNPPVFCFCFFLKDLQSSTISLQNLLFFIQKILIFLWAFSLGFINYQSLPKNILQNRLIQIYFLQYLCYKY